MSDTNFTKFVPGFDFLQGLVKNAGTGLPGIGQWVAPTLNPEELGKRIEELRTVQFWLEQNARMMGVTLQALEVQRMTLSTLQSMNVPLADLQAALKMPEPAAWTGIMPDMMAGAAKKPAASPKAAAAPAPAPAPAPAAPAVDPMQWWGALSQQFTELATKAMNESATDTATNIVKQSFDAAGETLRKAMPGMMAGKPAAAPKAPAAAAKPAAKAAAKPAAKAAAKTVKRRSS